MAASAGTELHRPDRYQEFESQCVKLWKSILNNPNVMKNGRPGQPQKGVDVWGYRNKNVREPVGVQCKQKGHGQVLTEAELRDEWRKALQFAPPITEYFLLTTADNDAKMEELARNLALEQADLGRNIEFYVWGWQKICDEVFEYPEVMRAFDPTYGVFAREHTAAIELVSIKQDQTLLEVSVMSEAMIRMEAAIATDRLDVTAEGSAIERHLDREIDSYRSIFQDGEPKIALSRLEAMLSTGHCGFRAYCSASRQTLGPAISNSIITPAGQHTSWRHMTMPPRNQRPSLTGLWHTY